WRIDITGSNLKQITNNSAVANYLQSSPDGRWLIYCTIDGLQTRVWKLSVEGGQPIQLTDHESDRPKISSDGKFIACRYGDRTPDSPRRLAIIPIEGGLPTKLLDLPKVLGSNNFGWQPDGRALTYDESR